MNDPREVIRRPIVTEKSMRGTTINKYTFEVDRTSPKPVIREISAAAVARDLGDSSR